MVVTIRDATIADAHAIAEVHVASWRWAYRDLLPEAVLVGLSVDARAEMWSSLLGDPDERSVVLVAVEDAAVVGFASAGPSRDSDAPGWEAEVFSLYLVEHVTGRGLGRELFAALAAALRDRGFERATLWVLEANERTRRFYEAAGWRLDGGHDRYEIEGRGYPELRYAASL